MMHHSVPVNQLGFLPSMYAFSVPTSLPEFDLGPQITPGHLQKGTYSNNSWEMRCLRKNRRREDDDVCGAKRRRLMETDVELLDNCTTNLSPDWHRNNSCSSGLLLQPSHVPPQSCAEPQLPPAPLTRLETDNSCMEIEAAQKKLREIEDRITLEDDDEDENLDVEPALRRPVLVLSDSLKEGLQRGISDILPHKVAQSVTHSCMELVLWRPLNDPFSQRLKGSLQKQRKQSMARQPPTPCPSPSPHTDSPSPLYSGPRGPSSWEEDMEM